MRKRLLASVALAAVVGCASIAAAQEGGKEGTGAGSGAGASHSQGAPQHQLSPSGGAGGAQHSQATPGGAAQNQAIPDKQGLGPPKGTSQNEERGSSTMQRGAQENDKTKMQRGAQDNDRTKMQRGAEENDKTKMQRGAEDNDRTKMQRGAEENDKTKMQRGAEENDKTKMQRGAEENDKTKTQRGAQENERTPGGNRENNAQIRDNRENNAQIQERGGRSTAQSRIEGAKSVHLSEDQRTRVKDIIVKDRNVARINTPSFHVAVGTTIPRDVHIATLPPDVVQVVPEYEGFDYVVVGDQLLVIDPDTMEIVAVLPA